MTEKRRLGRGLDALLGTPSDGSPHVAVAEIQQNPFQPRKAFDDEELESLSAEFSAGANLDFATVDLDALKANLDRAVAFYRHVWGLEPVVSEGDTIHLRANGPEHHALTLREQPKAGSGHRRRPLSIAGRRRVWRID